MAVKISVALTVLCTVVLYHQCEGRHRHRATPSGLVMPPRSKLMSWSTFVNKVIGKTWTQLYIWTQSDFYPATIRRFTMSPKLTSENEVVYPFHYRVDGECIQDTNLSCITTTFVHAPGERSARHTAGIKEERYFSRHPDSYILLARCFSRVVRGVCAELGLVSLFVNSYPPNQLDWLAITCDLRNAMRLSFQHPRFRFDGVGAGNECLGGDTPGEIDLRLPTDIEPLLYTLELQPHMYEVDPADFTFNGSVTALLRCSVATDHITLHINKLNITGAISLTEENGGAQLFSHLTFDTDRQFMIVHATQTLTPGQNYCLDIASFAGPLAPDSVGLYLSSYQRGNDTVIYANNASLLYPIRDVELPTRPSVCLQAISHKRYIATSQLQPTDARKTFPCLDEPAMKAEFEVTLVRKSHMIAISNMPIIRNETRDGDWIADTFQKTVKMSTYLLAFIICDFHYLENTTENGIPYRVWARPEAINQSAYALEIGVDLLRYFEDYFNIPYPLPKLDMIAIPDFASGAMENWGLITYREQAILFEQDVSSARNKQQIADAVTHELAHQWFGNLVTLSWWDDLWLNEGFATYMAYIGIDHIQPDWNILEQFLLLDLQPVFDFDGLVTSRPMFVPVSLPDEINELFDRIAYSKGAAIIRMMQFIVGEHTFRQGLTNYLNSLAFGSAFRDELWYALGNQSVADGNQITDVKGIMDTWILQMNYPTVTVEYTQAGCIKITQSRYLRDPNATDPGKYVSPFGYKWAVPFTYTTSASANFAVTKDDIHMMDTSGAQVDIIDATIPAPAGTNWVMGNIQQYGYYRVNYDNRNWHALIDQLKLDHTVIVPVNRAQLINDVWNLARSGDVTLYIALGITEYLSNEREYVPRDTAIRELHVVNTLLDTHPLYGAFTMFMQNITADVYNFTGVNNTASTPEESFLRSGVVETACVYGIPACVDEARRLFAEWMATPDSNPIHPDLRLTIYCAALAGGDIQEWDFAFDRQLVTNVAAEQTTLIRAMTCSRNISILTRYLEMSINAAQVRRQNTASVIARISWNTVGRVLAWDFFREHWEFYLTEFGAGPFTFGAIILELTRSFNTQLHLDELTEFIDSRNNLGSGARAFEQAVEKTRSNIRWMETSV